MPVKDLKYDVIMAGSIVASGLEDINYLKSELVNGDVQEFVIKASFNLVEVDNRSFTVESEPVSLSSYKSPDSSTALIFSNLASSSLTLSWTAGDLNGTKHSKYKVYDGEVFIKESLTSSVELTGLTKGKDYQLSVMTVSTRDELIGQTFTSDKSSVIHTSAPSKVRSLTASVLDRSLQISWLEPLDLGGYPLQKYRIMYLPKVPGITDRWVTMDDVISGVILSGLENGKEYQVRVIVDTYNTELDLPLNSGAQVVYGMPKSISTMPQNVSVVEQDGSFKVSWDGPETDNGSVITSYRLHIFNQTSQMSQVITLDASLREKTQLATNGVKYLVSLSAVNAIGSSPRSPDIEVIPFGTQSVSNVSVVGQTVSFSVVVNGRKVDDVSVLAIDSSPDVNENLFQTAQNQEDVIIGSQQFSKTFNFNHAIQKYLIVVRSASGQVVKTNFNV